jgi:DNA-binding NarL/FixJ family response regulator
MNNNMHIVILEPSHIIYEGLLSIFNNSPFPSKVTRISGLGNINSPLLLNCQINVIIINPSYIQNNIREFRKLKKTYINLYWIGLVYNYYDNEILALFDKVISITDFPDAIYHNIEGITTSKTEVTSDLSEDQLSEREIDVLIQLVNGLSNKEIADKLSISVHTVISHRKNISLKTGIKSQSGLTIYAITKNIISIDSMLK